MSHIIYEPVKQRLQRSELAVPGSNPKMFEKALKSSADYVFLDLEDAVAPDDKVPARKNIIEAINDLDWNGNGKTISVRINSIDTHYMYRDVVEVVEQAGDKLDTILLPKAGTASDVYMLSAMLNQIETSKGLKNRIGIEVLIETTLGMANVMDIAQKGREERPYGLRAIDGPFGDFNDPESYIDAAKRGAALGFEGKWAIHPSQIDLANEVYTPPESEVSHAKQILIALDEAAKEGRGAAQLNGRMIDAASAKMAENIVNTDNAINSKIKG
jgi:citrate lyase subunit beta/citryl-CoA lyase